MTAVTADFDEDGWPDIFVACDSTPSLLFMNNHDGTFREEGVMRGVALSDDGMEQAGMGVGVGTTTSMVISTCSRPISSETRAASTATTEKEISTK